jgi:sortase A
VAPPLRLIAAAACAGLAVWQLGAGAAIAVKAEVAQVLLRAAWQRTRDGERHVRPWPWADTWPIARLTVPGDDVDLIVLDGASGRTLAFGPGHLDGTAPPGGIGNSVIAGHRDTHLAFLRRLAPGSTVELELPDGRDIAYRVTRTAVVDSRIAQIDAAAGGRALTLVTCYPFDALIPGGPLRYVVFAEAAAAR